MKFKWGESPEHVSPTNGSSQLLHPRLCPVVTSGLMGPLEDCWGEDCSPPPLSWLTTEPLSCPSLLPRDHMTDVSCQSRRGHCPHLQGDTTPETIGCVHHLNKDQSQRPTGGKGGESERESITHFLSELAAQEGTRGVLGASCHLVGDVGNVTAGLQHQDLTKGSCPTTAPNRGPGTDLGATVLCPLPLPCS